MSGQPVQTEGDVDRFRNEYMQSLALQAQLEDMNLQANKIYLQTGQLPPQSQMTDTRTTAEKLKDIVSLKQTIVQELRPIAEPQFALNIVNSVEQSAMNIDGGFLRWLAQNTPEIVNNLSRKYKLGIAGDSNDVQVIISFLETMYSDIKNSMKSVKSYINSSTSVSGRPDVLSQNDFNQIIKMMEEVITIIDRSNFRLRRPEIAGFITSLRHLYNCILNTDEINNLRELISSKYNFEDLGERKLIDEEPENLGSLGFHFKIYSDIMEKMPKSKVVYMLLDKLTQSVKNNDQRYINNIVTQIIDLFSGITEENNLNELYTRSEELRTLMSFIYEMENQNEKSYNSELKNVRKLRRDLGIQQVLVVNDGPSQSIPVHEQPKGEIPQNWGDYARSLKEFSNLTNLNYRRSDDTDSITSSILSSESLHKPPEPKPSSSETSQRLTEPESIPKLPEYMSKFHPDITAIISDLRDKYYSRYQLADDKGKEELEQIMFQNASNIYDTSMNFYNFRKNYIYPAMGIKGKGIRKGRPRGGSIVPVPKKPAFVGFGINEIDQLKLDKNILSIRRNTRSKIKGMGNKHISEPMKRIIKNFIGGSVPNYNDLSSLDNEEKEYLNKIVEHSDLKDRLSVPAPSKDQREKDFHSFEVMKGEILAGNDSKELIKKFKLLMIKLSRQNLLPKSEVQELMEELVELGY